MSTRSTSDAAAQAHRVLGRRGLGDDLEVGLGLEQRADPRADHRVVVAEQQPDHACHHRDAHGDRGALARRGLDLDRAALALGPLPHRAQAERDPVDLLALRPPVGSNPTPSSTTSSATSSPR